MLIDKFRLKLQRKGVRGLISVQRMFKMLDVSGTGKIDQYEFNKTIEDLGLNMERNDMTSLFKSFDRSNDGKISWSEFVETIKGFLSQFRRDVIERVFRQLDLTNQSKLLVRDIKLKFNPAGHPDVKAGKRTDTEIQQEFTETFDHHHSIQNPGSDYCDLREFTDYFSHVSSQIE